MFPIIILGVIVFFILCGIAKISPIDCKNKYEKETK